MNRQRLDTYDDFPSGMKEYLQKYGWHFSKKMFEWAVSGMRKKNAATGKDEPVECWDKERVDEFLKKNGIQLKNDAAYDAAYVTVLMNLEEQADSMGVNPTLYGTVTFVDINDLTIRDANGTEVSFDNSISREVTFGGIKAGTEVRVTYMGSIYPENQISDDEGTGSGAPVAIKIVSEDAVNSEEAAADYITGPVSDVSEGSITVDTSYDSFTFTADPSMLSGIEESQNVRVYYEGVLAAGRSIPATQVTAG